MEKKALNNVTGSCYIPNKQVIEEGLAQSRKNSRRRIILPIHRTQDAPVQRMLNFVQPGTYIRPHLHPRKHAVETIIVYRGAIRFLLFDDNGNGNIEQKIKLEANSHRFMADIEPRIWHSFVVLQKDTILVETKMGPYDAERDKTFASWAPSEQAPEAKKWVDIHT